MRLTSCLIIARIVYNHDGKNSADGDSDDSSLWNSEIRRNEVFRKQVMVFGASFVCAFGVLNYQHKLDDFLSVITNQSSLPQAATQVFTGNPDF